MNNLVVGQEVAIQESNGRFIFGYSVSKITPKGQIVVSCGDLTMRFNKNGNEVASGSLWRRRNLVADIELAKAKTDKEKREQEARNAINLISKCATLWPNSNKMGMVEYLKDIEELLNNAKAMVNKI